MPVSIIVAFDENRLIGRDNGLPWHLPADLKHFKQITMGHYMIMGRKTFESIGKPLPGRTSVVITRQPDLKYEGCIMASSLEDALAKCPADANVFIIGGAEIFNQSLPLCDFLHTTLIHHQFEGDTHFSELNPSEWEIVSREDFEADEKNQWAYSYIDYKRI
jgi:dihydrofolate reductase